MLKLGELSNLDSAVILAGGLGSRLGDLVKKIPKPALKINGKAFIFNIIENIIKYKVKEIIICVGYKYKVLKKIVGTSYNGVPIIYSIESEPLGTGGAIYNALPLIKSNYFFLLNGDSLFKVNLKKLKKFSLFKNSDVSFYLKKVSDSSRFGKVAIDNQGRVIKFLGKNHQGGGFINGGVYYVNKKVLNHYEGEKNFSFEDEILKKQYNSLQMFGLISRKKFIDIGIVTDLKKFEKNSF